ncbi:cdc2-related protein kinase [Cryptosporidium ryanae]|uniref:cdc2-related protein kinase n=1 Tax=Cryptosporidium ryanae TaxID=515981 RepID=UPI00351A1082|nr:cdc2-related protein kinase [Cryptosporidium ryanae]
MKTMSSRSLSSFVKIRRIGHGAFGDVWLAEDIIGNRSVALKKLISKETREGFSKSAIREIILLRKLNHRNIVKLYGVIFSKPRQSSSESSTRDNNNNKVANNNKYMDKGSVWMVFEYLPFDLTGYMESLRLESRTIRVIDIKVIIRQLLLSLEYCHSNNVIHRDIKCANLLISAEGVLKLADFGLARMYDSRNKAYTNRVITLWYRPPELLLGSQVYDTAVDMWSVGCILGELILQQPLFCSETEKGILKSIGDLFGPPPSDILSEYEKLPLWEDSDFNPLLKNLGSGRGPKYEQFVFRVKSKVGSRALDLLLSLLRYSPTERLTASEALKHPWLNSSSSHGKIPKKLDMSVLVKRKQFHSLTARKLREKLQGRFKPPSEISGAPNAKVGKAYFVERIRRKLDPSIRGVPNYTNINVERRKSSMSISISPNNGYDVIRPKKSNKERQESPTGYKDRYRGREHNEHRYNGEHDIGTHHSTYDNEGYNEMDRIEYERRKRDHLERDEYNSRSLERESEQEYWYTRYSRRRDPYEDRGSRHRRYPNSPSPSPPNSGHPGNNYKWWRSPPRGNMEYMNRVSSTKSGRTSPYDHRGQGYEYCVYRR